MVHQCSSITSKQKIISVTTLDRFKALLLLYNIVKSQSQTMEIRRVGLNSVETEFSQMPDLLCDNLLRGCQRKAFSMDTKAIQASNDLT